MEDGGAPTVRVAPVGPDAPGDPADHGAGADPRSVLAVRCGACGAQGSAGRELCRTCGADLDPRPAVLAAVVPPRRRARQDRRAEELRRRAPGAVAALTLALVAAALLSGALDRPVEEGPAPLGPVALDRTSYPGDAELLAVRSVATSTTAQVEGRDITPLALIDGDGSSAWIALPAGEDAVETIELVLESPAWVDRLQVRNGDHRSPEDHELSGRLQQALLTFDGRRTHRVDLLDLGRQVQVVRLREPELTTRITLQVERVVPGSGPSGVALSELTVVGWPAQGADVALARARADQGGAEER